MAATQRIPLLILLLTTLTAAVQITVTGDASVGEALTLTWDGEAPFSLDILTATSPRDAFTLYRSFSPITVTNGVWNVDVAAGTLVEFEISDATGDSASKFVQIGDGGLGLSSSSVASQSSESVASTQSVSESLPSVFSESSVAWASSRSVASTSSIAALTTSTATPTDSNVVSPSQTVTRLPSATLGASSSAATQTSSTVVPPNQLNISSGSKPGAIAGGVIAAILGLLLLLVLGRICYRRRQRVRDQAQDAKIYPFMVDEALTNTASSIHRRTLSRSKPDVVNWNPEEPRLTPAGPVAGNMNYRLSSSLVKFGELGASENGNALGMVLSPTPAPVAPTPAPPPPVMTTVPNATMPSVLDLAKGSTKRESDMPLYNTASIYNPTSLQQPNFSRPLLDIQSGSGTKISPFADKFAVEGKYEPDLYDPAVMASVASAQAPRPPRPTRPEGLKLEGPSNTDAATPAPPPARPQRNSISNPNPVLTVGHTRKISGPIPIVTPRSPPVRSRQQRSVDLLPSWALVNSDGRYPAITVQTPTTATTVSSPTGSMAGVGAGRVASIQPGRQIYPAAALPPSRQPSLKGKRVSVAQSEKGISAVELQAARAQSPPIRSPPPGVMSAQSPTAFATRAQSPPAILARAQSPIMAAIAQSPPPSISRKPSSSVDGPPRPPRAVGPRPKPVAQRSTSATPPAPIVSLPLTPPRRILADPDVPTTPTTPALSAFPTPPRSMNTVIGSSPTPSSLTGSTGHKLKGSGSSVGSSTSTIFTMRDSSVGPVPTTAATSAYPDFELDGPTPVTSPQVRGRALQPPPPISTGLYPASSLYAVSSAPNGLSPITASPQSVQHPQIPTPLASSTIASPILAQFGQAMLRGSGGITRDSSVKTTYTMSTASEGAHAALRKELMQGLPSAVGTYYNVGGPTSPIYFPESVSNFNPPVPQLPLPVTSSARVPRPAVESWGLAPSIYDASSMNGLGKHVSIAPSYLSANSGWRFSESTVSGDAEWKELERQLAITGGDVTHIMPRNNGAV